MVPNGFSYIPMGGPMVTVTDGAVVVRPVTGLLARVYI